MRNGTLSSLSLIFTKFEFPICYGDLVLIEDMKFENSNYFLRANGFISKKIKLSSLNHDQFFEMTSCAFRIYPKTWNINKNKVLDYVQNGVTLNEEEINFKFSREILNNLKIVQNKFNQPIHYGDYVMLLHENTRTFIKYLPHSKKLTLSNHDSEATVFSLEPASEIMYNDNQIIKTGQPIQIKIAWFTYENQGLYFSIRFPYSAESKKTTTNTLDDKTNFNNVNNEQINLNNDDLSKHSSLKGIEEEYEDDDKMDDQGEREVNNFDPKQKLYKKEPELVVEENSTMKWRLTLFSPFTKDENLMIYSDMVHIFHCNLNSILTIDEIEEQHPERISSKLRNTVTQNIKFNIDQIKYTDSNSSFDLNESGISLINNKSFSEIDNQEFTYETLPITVQFYLRQTLAAALNQDVNSIWTIENIFPLMKKQSFIRYFEDVKLDTYRMVFRIKNFKTNKILSVCPITSNAQLDYLNTEDDLYKKGYLEGSGINNGKFYKFCLIDDKSANKDDIDLILNERYQYSLFAFKKMIQSKTYHSNLPEKNDFLRLFHIATKSYLKVIPTDKLQQSHLSATSGDIANVHAEYGYGIKMNKMIKCVLTLTKYPEEKDVFKICPVDPNSQWKFRFLNNLYYLLQVIIHHIDDALKNMNQIDGYDKEEKNKNDNEDEQEDAIPTPKLRFSTLQMINFILDKLLKFAMNKFINKFSNECGFNSVVKGRQTLIANFGFTHSLLKRFIYNFWLHDGTMVRMSQLNELLYKISSSEEALSSVNNLNKNEKVLYAMYKYTESVFDFSIVYCKDNNLIKAEVYEHLYVYFYFLNIIESCLYGMIEIFKNNQTILHSLIKDCKQKEKFKKALTSIIQEYFPKPETNSQNLTVIDLVFEYVRISRYVLFPSYNNYLMLHKAQGMCNTISLLSREKYFELLNAMVFVKDGSNILENQRCIIDHIITNEEDNYDHFILRDFLDNKDLNDYAPCLKELLYNMASQNPDDNIQRFLNSNANLQIEKLLDIKTNTSNSIVQLAANMKMIIYLIEFNNQKKRNSDNEEIMKYEKFLGDVRKFFAFQKTKFIDMFIDEYGEWKIDFLNSAHVNLVVAALQFLKEVYENGVVDAKQEKAFFVNLMRFLTRNSKMFQQKRFSSLVHGEMSKMQMMLNDRITKTEHGQYISIAESWLKVYQVFKNVLTKLIENEHIHLIAEKKEATMIGTGYKNGVYYSTLKKTVKTNAIAKNYLQNKHSKSQQNDCFTLQNFNNFQASPNGKDNTAFSSEKQTFGDESEQNNINNTDDITNMNIITTGDNKILNKKTHKYIKQTTNVMNLNLNKDSKRKKIFFDNQDESNSSKSISNSNNDNNAMPNNTNQTDNSEEPLKSEELGSSQSGSSNHQFQNDNQHKNKENELFYEKTDLIENDSQDNHFGVNTLESNLPNNTTTNLISSNTKEITKKHLGQNPSKKQSYYTLQGLHYTDSIFDKADALNLNDDFNDISKIITREDEQTHNKNEISKNIINLFKIIVKQNIQTLNNNFYDYYSKLRYDDNDTKFNFKAFIENCVPNLDSGLDDINAMIRIFCEDKFRSKFPCAKRLSNFNLEFDDKRTKDLNFTQNLIVAFNITDDLSMQEAILSLIYNYFNQRKVFFKNVTLFNEHVITFRQAQTNPFNDKVKIKGDFKRFYQTYEKNKHEYIEDDFQTIEEFFTLLFKQLLILFKKILNYWKYEFRALSLENASKYYKKFEENETLIKEIENIIGMIAQLETNISKKECKFTKEFYLDVIEDLIKVFYFVNRNSYNNVFTSLLAILNENGVVFNKMYYSLMNDFIYKGERFSTNFQDKILYFYKKKNTKQTDTDKIINIKNKFFSCFFLLITLQVITIPKSEKLIRYLNSLLQNQHELMKYDSLNEFLILLHISDLQKETLSFNYFAVLEKIKTLNQTECFGDLDTRMHINRIYPRTFTNLYLDIMLNVFKYVISKGYIINEANLDEMLVENVLFLIKKAEHNIYFTKEDVNAEFVKSLTYSANNNAYSNTDISKCSILTKIVRIINYCNEISNLNKIFLIKIDPNIKTNFDNELNFQYEQDNKNINFDRSESFNAEQVVMRITDYFPKPHQLYYLFSSSMTYVFDSDTANKQRAVVSTKYVYELYKYFIFYIMTIDSNYFTGMELYTHDKKEKEQIRYFIELILFGDKERNQDINDEDVSINNDRNNLPNNKNNKNIPNHNFYDFLELTDEKSRTNYDKFINSSFYLLLNLFTNSSIPNLQTFCRFVQINYESYSNQNDNIIENLMMRSISNFSDETSINKSTKEQIDEDIENDKNNSSNYSENEMKEMKQFLTTGDNPQVNYYILKKLKLIYPDCYYVQKYPYYKRKLRKLSKDKLYHFKQMLYENKSELKTLSKNESSSLIYDLLVLLTSGSKSQQDQIFYTFMNKLVDFLNRSCKRRLNNKTVKLNNYLLFIVKRILVFYEENEERLKTSTLRKKSLREMQILVEKTGIVEACLNLVRAFSVPEVKEMLPHIFSLFCRILKKGNSNSQEAFYSTFTMRNKYELVFSFMLDTVSNKMNFILSNKSKILKHKKKKISLENKIFFNNKEASIDSKILQFLQLLCENHNRKLQLFLHSQNNFRKSYDLVSHTQHYLTVLFNHFEPFLFEPLVKCFDLLIEFTQGPCLENQLALINSKLLITINDILKYYIASENTELGKHFPKVNLFHSTERNDSIRNETGNGGGEDSDNQVEKNFAKMSTPQISLLAFKSSILLLALVENRTKDDQIYTTLQSIIKPEILRNVCCKIYFEYLYTLIISDELSDYKLKLNAFGRSGDVEDNSKTIVIKPSNFRRKKEPTDVKDYFILETGFFLYFLLLYYQDYEMNLIKKEQEKIKDKGILHAIYSFFDGTIFVSLSIFIYDSIMALLKTLTFLISCLMYACSFGHFKVFNLLRIILKHKTYHDDDCWYFYTIYTESIEVLRGEKVYKVYFYLMPFCKKLNKFEKTHFLEGIDRTNSKSKLKDIMKYANKMKYELEKDFVIKEFLFYFPIIGVMFKNVELWKDLSLILNIIQNFFNIFAVRKVGQIKTIWLSVYEYIQIGYWHDEKSFFNMSPEDFFEVINALSIAQTCLAILIFVEYILRKVPSVYCITDEQVISKGYSNIKRRAIFFGKFIIRLCADFELWYYAGYVVFAILGNYSSDFFNAFLLMEVIQRIKTLRNIFKAIQNSFKKFILVLLFWLVINYIFSLLGYAFFKKEFPYPHDCSTLFKCFATIFYQTIRMDNGIAGYLNTYYEEGRSQNPFIWRFWYDEIANFILKIVVGDILSGIIVDTFLALRMEEMEMRSDMKNICTICSLNRKDISDVYEPRGKTYHDHINEDHKIFNYVFYIIYLYKKDTTEFTGIESYIYDLAVLQKEISWFPLEKLYIAKDGELESKNKEEEDNSD